jgi:protein SCO1/2
VSARVTALFAAVLVLGATSIRALEPVPPHVHEHAATPAPDPLPGASLYRLEVGLEAVGRGRVPLAALAGRPAVVTMFYSSCTSVCPMLTLAMQRTERALEPAARHRAVFVMVSLDPARDSLERLGAFAREHRLDPARWLIARASEEDVRSLAAALGIRYRQLPDGSFNHSSVMTLLDRDGVPLTRTQVLAAVDDAFVASLRSALH